MQFRTLDTALTVHQESNNHKLGFVAFKKFGSAATEPRDFRGISHLCEHLVCRAWDDMDDELTRRGVSHNAGTGDVSVQYFFQGLDAHIDEVTDKLLLREGPRNILNWVPSEAEFERERKVVIQEYEGYMSKPFNAMYVNLGRRYFDFDTAIGDIEVLQAMTYDKFIPFFLEQRSFDAFMRVGGSERSQSVLADFVAADPTPRQFLESTRPYMALVNTNRPVEFRSKSNGEVVIGDWLCFDDSVAPWEIAMITELFDAGVKSPLIDVLRVQHGLSYTAGMFRVGAPVPVAMSFVTVNPDNVNKARSLLHGVYTEWEKHITPDRFATAVAGVRVQNQLKEASNYKWHNAAEAISAPLVNVTNALLDTFTYERVCSILSKFFVKENIHRAQVGEFLEI